MARRSLQLDSARSSAPLSIRPNDKKNTLTPKQKTNITVAIFTSPESTNNASAEKVYARFSNLENLSALLQKIPADKIPADKRDMLEGISVDANSITIPGGPIGSMRLVMSEREEPTLIRMRGEGLPVALSLSLRITPVDADSCKTQVAIEIDVPAMMLPMIKGPLQKAVDQTGAIIPAIPYED